MQGFIYLPGEISVWGSKTDDSSGMIRHITKNFMDVIAVFAIKQGVLVINLMSKDKFRGSWIGILK